MKYNIKRFKSLAIALKELEPFIVNGKHLQTGRPFTNFDGMLSREVLANWLICVVANQAHGDEARMTFTSDPLGGDGVILDTATDETWPMEHVMVPYRPDSEPVETSKTIMDAIDAKNNKGGTAYASGKTLVVFLNNNGGVWYPNRIAKALPADLSFGTVWAVAFQSVEDGNTAPASPISVSRAVTHRHGSWKSPATSRRGGSSAFNSPLWRYKTPSTDAAALRIAAAPVQSAAIPLSRADSCKRPASRVQSSGAAEIDGFKFVIGTRLAFHQ